MNSDEVAFLPTDFERFRESVQTDPEFNEARLEVRRKLESIGKSAADALSAPPYLLVARASIHHPHQFNGFRVAQQCTYLSRGKKERTFLKKHLGDEIGEDLDTDYTHTQLVLQIDEQGLIFALRIHAKAWWDGENLKRLLGDEDERPTIASDSLSTALRIGGQTVGIGFSDPLRSDAGEALAALKAHDISSRIISGDRAAPVESVATKLGIAAHAELLPEDKLALLEELKAAGHRPLMVGDGINDGPALAAAHASIAPGSARLTSLKRCWVAELTCM